MAVTLLADEADRQRRLARAHLAEAALATQRATRHEAGDRGELVVRQRLEALAAQGWTVLHRRRWPGTRRADIDHLLIGPGGVVVLDTKNWTDAAVSGGRVMRGQDDASDVVTGLADQVRAVEDVLVGAGLAPLEVVGGLVFVQQPLGVVLLGRVHACGLDALLPWLHARGTRLDPEAVVALTAILEEQVPPVAADDAPVVPVSRARPRARVDESQGALFTTQELDLTELERASSLSLEQWMVYLHPAQLEVVRRRYSGPCRVRGPAGCGKTVVALHRAAYLAAQEPGELLFLSFVRTLPAVLSNLFARLAPQAASRVRFCGVHQLALTVLRDAGVTTRLDASAADTAFSRAWVRVGREHLEDHGLGVGYWQEEVRKVIKGRGLHDFADYRQLTRTGRRTRLTAGQREHVWDLYVAYQELLDEKGVHDFEDVVAMALAVARRPDGPRYRFVLVDEAQDLDLLSMQLAAALVDDDRDGLTLVGDGQQAIYAGGFTLKEAGLHVTGRSTVLEINYRNTRQVLEAATDVVRVDDFDDLEDVGEPGDRTVVAVRDGTAVVRVVAADVGSLEVALVRQLTEDATLGRPIADAAVLVRTRREADHLRALLRQHGVDSLSLEDYDGRPVAAVKVGTVKRAKGLEFGRVFLPRSDSWLVADGAAEPERIERERRELFVAMTRARDGLWLGRVSAEVVVTASQHETQQQREHEADGPQQRLHDGPGLQRRRLVHLEEAADQPEA